MKPETISWSDAEPAPAALGDALAAELVRITRDLAELAYDLGSEPTTLRRHMSSLQAIDRITQTQLGIADVLRARGTVAERLSVVTLQDMAERLETYLDEREHD